MAFKKRLSKIAFLGLSILLAAACAVQDISDETVDVDGASSTADMTPEETEDWSVKPVQLGFDADMKPSDAISLFDGSSLDAWQGDDGGAALWKVEDNIAHVSAGAGGISTRENFCDIQLHLEWRSPSAGVNGNGTGQNWGNSGVFLQSRYEVQVLNSNGNETYANGQAGSIYKQYPPLVNASKAPGAWQAYDIIFKAPEFAEDGQLISPAFVTVLHNGVIVQNHSEIKGSTRYIGHPFYEAHGCAPLHLQDHGEPVEYRNIWVRKL